MRWTRLVRVSIVGVDRGRSTMRRFLPLLVILLVGCGGAPGSAPADGQTTASSAPTDSGGSAGSVDPGSSPAATVDASTAPTEAPSAAAGSLPAACAEGFAAYLVELEPIVSSFDPAKATLGDLATVDQAVDDKSYELLQANDSTAPYSCPEAGLDWAYFDADTAWDAVLVVAADAAPGTVAYLTALQAWKQLDVAVVADYGIEGCDAAVAGIKEQVADATADGQAEVADMPLADGLALLGLYRAYLHDVQDEVCPRDALGNDEFDFFGRMG